jgi:hypothetical protein
MDNLTTITAFERENDLKLNSKIKQKDLADEAPYGVAVPQTFKFDKDWLYNYAFREKNFFKEVKKKVEKSYTTRIVRYDESNFIILVTESLTFNHRKILDKLYINEEECKVSSETKKPSDFKPLVEFMKATVYAEENNVTLDVKRGELALIVNNDVMEVALKYLSIFADI